MIGLRVLHLATSLDAATSDGVLVLMGWLQNHGHDAALAAGGEATVDPGAAPGCNLIRYRSKAPAWWLGGKKALLERVAEWNPDLIHLHRTKALPAARALSRKLGLPVVVSIDHGIEPAAARNLRDPCIAWVLVPTEAHRAHFISRARLDRDLVAVLPQPVAIEDIPPRTGTGPLVAAMAGACDVASGIDDFLDAIVWLRRDGSAITALVTEDVHDDHLDDAIRHAEAQSWVEVVHEPVRHLLKRADLLVYPARTDRPARAVVEAMACARPVIVTAVDGLPELVSDGQNGLLVPPGDVSALAGAIGKLERDPELRRRLAAAGRATAAERFDANVVGEAAVELYCSALSEARNTSAKAEGSRAYRRATDQKPGRTA
jgi:glycosyltransferase involved in cell wall biosynthesis